MGCMVCAACVQVEGAGGQGFFLNYFSVKIPKLLLLGTGVQAFNQLREQGDWHCKGTQLCKGC